jgi:hypothetical protein
MKSERLDGVDVVFSRRAPRGCHLRLALVSGAEKTPRRLKMARPQKAPLAALATKPSRPLGRRPLGKDFFGCQMVKANGKVMTAR